jgi:hypothetical protein
MKRDPFQLSLLKAGKATLLFVFIALYFFTGENKNEETKEKPSTNGIAQQPAPVKVSDGMLQGTFEDGLTVYKGIPFAAPPVGDLRWRAPQPPVKWDGVRRGLNNCRNIYK